MKQLIIFLLICRTLNLAAGQIPADLDNRVWIHGYEITGASDDSDMSAENTHVLVTQKAVNKAMSGGVGSRVPKTTTLTINSVPHNLATDRSWDVGTVTSLTAGTGLSGGVITGSGTISMPNTGTAGTYERSTTDAQGRVTSGYNPVTNAATRPINSTTWTISATQAATVVYYIKIQCTATIGSAANGTVELQYSTNGGSSWVPVGQAFNSNTVTLAIALNSVQATVTPIVYHGIPANALCRMVSTLNGTTTATFIYGFETY